MNRTANRASRFQVPIVYYCNGIEGGGISFIQERARAESSSPAHLTTIKDVYMHDTRQKSRSSSSIHTDARTYDSAQRRQYSYYFAVTFRDRKLCCPQNVM